MPALVASAPALTRRPCRRFSNTTLRPAMPAKTARLSASAACQPKLSTSEMGAKDGSVCHQGRL